ncbi:MAG: enoyl-CoA hydratase, partial [Burkholderia sp.]|nr:enoyl-CoA hydratase [Burkholderia sp.]
MRPITHRLLGALRLEDSSIAYPEAARFGGFDKPILHGLCTFGHCAHLLLSALCDGDPARFR